MLSALGQLMIGFPEMVHARRAEVRLRLWQGFVHFPQQFLWFF
jgi:hypothetical protein